MAVCLAGVAIRFIKYTDSSHQYAIFEIGRVSIADLKLLEKAYQPKLGRLPGDPTNGTLQKKSCTRFFYTVRICLYVGYMSSRDRQYMIEETMLDKVDSSKVTISYTSGNMRPTLRSIVRNTSLFWDTWFKRYPVNWDAKEDGEKDTFKKKLEVLAHLFEDFPHATRCATINHQNTMMFLATQSDYIVFDIGRGRFITITQSRWKPESLDLILTDTSLNQVWILNQASSIVDDGDHVWWTLESPYIRGQDIDTEISSLRIDITTFLETCKERYKKLMASILENHDNSPSADTTRTSEVKEEDVMDFSKGSVDILIAKVKGILTEKCRVTGDAPRFSLRDTTGNWYRGEKRTEFTGYACEFYIDNPTHSGSPDGILKIEPYVIDDNGTDKCTSVILRYSSSVNACFRRIAYISSRAQFNGTCATPDMVALTESTEGIGCIERLIDIIGRYRFERIICAFTETIPVGINYSTNFKPELRDFDECQKRFARALRMWANCHNECLMPIFTPFEQLLNRDERVWYVHYPASTKFVLKHSYDHETLDVYKLDSKGYIQRKLTDDEVRRAFGYDLHDEIVAIFTDIDKRKKESVGKPFIGKKISFDDKAPKKWVDLYSLLYDHFAHWCHRVDATLQQRNFCYSSKTWYPTGINFYIMKRNSSNGKDKFKFSVLYDELTEQVTLRFFAENVDIIVDGHQIHESGYCEPLISAFMFDKPKDGVKMFDITNGDNDNKMEKDWRPLDILKVYFGDKFWDNIIDIFGKFIPKQTKPFYENILNGNIMKEWRSDPEYQFFEYIRDQFSQFAREWFQGSVKQIIKSINAVDWEVMFSSSRYRIELRHRICVKDSNGISDDCLVFYKIDPICGVMRIIPEGLDHEFGNGFRAHVELIYNRVRTKIKQFVEEKKMTNDKKKEFEDIGIMRRWERDPEYRYFNELRTEIHRYLKQWFSADEPVSQTILSENSVGWKIQTPRGQKYLAELTHKTDDDILIFTERNPESGYRTRTVGPYELDYEFGNFFYSGIKTIYDNIREKMSDVVDSVKDETTEDKEEFKKITAALKKLAESVKSKEEKKMNNDEKKELEAIVEDMTSVYKTMKMERRVSKPNGLIFPHFSTSKDGVKLVTIPFETYRTMINTQYGTSVTIVKDRASTIKDAYWNPKTGVATILWADGTKTMSKPMEGTTADPEIGFALCIAKKMMGGTQNKWRKWLKSTIDASAASAKKKGDKSRIKLEKQARARLLEEGIDSPDSMQLEAVIETIKAENAAASEKNKPAQKKPGRKKKTN